MPPSFVNQQGVHDGNGQHNFSGPPPAIMPMFDNAPPHLRAGPPGIVFEGGPIVPAQFPSNNGGGHTGIVHPAFGEFAGNRGAHRGGWRGRGAPPFGGRGGGRGCFRDGPPGTEFYIIKRWNFAPKFLLLIILRGLRLYKRFSFFNFM